MVPELRYQSAVIGAVALAVVTQEAKRQVGPRRIWNVVLSVEALTLAFGQRFSGDIEAAATRCASPRTDTQRSIASGGLRPETAGVADGSFRPDRLQRDGRLTRAGCPARTA